MKLDPWRKALLITYVGVLIGGVVAALAFQALGNSEMVRGVMTTLSIFMLGAPVGYAAYKWFTDNT